MHLAASTRRFHIKLMLLTCMTCAAGCSKPAFKAYNGPERLPSETATIRNSSQFAFWSSVDLISVDDQNVLGRNEITVLPGAHWCQVMVTRRSKPAMLLMKDAFYVEATCGFKMEAAPGTTYRFVDVDNDGPTSDNVSVLYKALLEIEERVVGGDFGTRNIPVECARWELFHRGWYKLRDDMKSKGGFLCRGNQDCLVEEAVCNVGTDFTFGICRKP
jgi:hypothetical protein